MVSLLHRLFLFPFTTILLILLFLDILAMNRHGGASVGLRDLCSPWQTRNKINLHSSLRFK